MYDIPPFRPYLLVAARNYCLDNGLIPYIKVTFDSNEDLVVPNHVVKDNQLVLSVSDSATRDGVSEWEYNGEKGWTFTSSFQGKAFTCYVPYKNIEAIFSSDNKVVIPFDSDEYTETTTESPKSDTPKFGVIDGGKS